MYRRLKTMPCICDNFILIAGLWALLNCIPYRGILSLISLTRHLYGHVLLRSHLLICHAKKQDFTECVLLVFCSNMTRARVSYCATPACVSCAQWPCMREYSTAMSSLQSESALSNKEIPFMKHHSISVLISLNGFIILSVFLQAFLGVERWCTSKDTKPGSSARGTC